jgi:hypothetical protein
MNDADDRATRADQADTGRRQFAVTLLGALGGAAILEGCAQSGAPESVAEIVQAATGTSTLAWVDTVFGLPIPAPPTARSAGDLATKTSSQLGATVVIAKGCLTPGDGGGGLFFWDSSGTDDGGTVVVPNANVGASGVGGCWKRVSAAAGPDVKSIRWFGAGGNGATDDTTAIQRALDAVATTGGSVYVPPGSYLVKSSDPDAGLRALLLSGSNVRLFGEGPSSEIFVDEPGIPAGPTKIQRYDVLDIDAGSSYVVIENLLFRGRNDPFGGVYPYNADNGHPQQAAIASRTTSATSHHVTIRNVIFRNLYSHVVRTADAGEHHWFIVDCEVYQCTNGMNGNGTDFVYQGGSVIQANGIECSGDRCRIIGVTISDGSGISIGGKGNQTQQPQVIGCRLRNITVGSGIGAAGCTDGLIEDNVVDGVSTGFHGIFIDTVGAFNVPSGPMIVKGNTVKNLTGNLGIWVHDGPGTIVDGNNVSAAISALMIQCPNVTVRGNRANAPGHTDITLSNANGILLTADNVLVNNAFFQGGTTTGRCDFVRAGAPPAGLDPPNGSTYTRTDGTGPNLYVRQNGAWVAK